MSHTSPFPPLDSIDILTLLPQQPPFVLVDRLVHYDEQSTICQFTLPTDHLMVEKGVLSEAGILENMAQTCAARLGFYNKYVLRERVRIGYIGAVRGFVVHRLPKVGETLSTTIHIEQEIMGITLAAARVMVGETLIAEATLKIALGEELPETPQQ